MEISRSPAIVVHPGDWLRAAAARLRSPALAPSADARVKWTIIAAIGLVDAVWMRAAGYQFGSGYWQHLAIVALLGTVSLAYCHLGRQRRIREFAHFGAQFDALVSLLVPLSYLAVATDLPLVDARFDAIDKAVGFDWLAFARWVTGHPAVATILALAYASAPFQVLFAFLYNAHADANRRNAELWWITLLAALPTLLLGALFPALSTWVYYGILGINDLPHMQHFAAMRDGAMHVISLRGSQGMVQLPSFHTVIAVAMAYNFRGNRRLFAAALLLNLLLIAACPVAGGHYFIDIPAGAVVAAAAIWGARDIQRRLDRVSRPAGLSLPTDRR